MNTEEIITYVATRGSDLALNLVAAIAILVVGRWLAKALSAAMTKVVEKKAQDATVVGFVGSLTYVTLMVVVVLAAVSQLGVQTTSFIAILGAAGLAVGLALQGSLANFASGFLMLVFRPIAVGEYVEAAGTEGTVREIGIFTTTLLTPDNKVIIVGNSNVTGANVVNYSRESTRRINLVFGIDYGDDIKKAKEVLLDEMTRHELVLPEPAPVVGVLELGDNSVQIAARPWTKTADFWRVRFDLMESIKYRFDAEGLSFPFPQRDVHLHGSSDAA